MNIQRKSLRLNSHNYKKTGYYFITICIYNGDYILGMVKHDTMILNEKGIMINKWWRKLNRKFINVTLDEYIIMPNHMHGIINLVGADPCVCPQIEIKNPIGDFFIPRVEIYDKNNVGEHMGSLLQDLAVSIPKVFQ